MRTIKFRGRRTDNGEWLLGNLLDGNRIVGSVVDWDSDYFCTEFWYMVDPDTVGQYTGIKDKNGKEIYEGDIIQITEHPFESNTYKVNGNYQVAYTEEMELVAGSWLLFRMRHYAEVIGNIYEHPHLLGGA